MARAEGTPPLTAELASYIKWMLSHTTLAQHQIAAQFGINQGRVSEVGKGKKFPGVLPTRPRRP